MPSSWREVQRRHRQLRRRGEEAVDVVGAQARVVERAQRGLGHQVDRARARAATAPRSDSAAPAIATLARRRHAPLLVGLEHRQPRAVLVRLAEAHAHAHARCATSSAASPSTRLIIRKPSSSSTMHDAARLARRARGSPSRRRRCRGPRSRARSARSPRRRGGEPRRPQRRAVGVDLVDEPPLAPGLGRRPRRGSVARRRPCRRDAIGRRRCRYARPWTRSPRSWSGILVLFIAARSSRSASSTRARAPSSSAGSRRARPRSSTQNEIDDLEQMTEAVNAPPPRARRARS